MRINIYVTKLCNLFIKKNFPASKCKKVFLVCVLQIILQEFRLPYH